MVRIAVVGLGYVGLPLAVAFARRFSNVLGFDVDSRKTERLGQGIDPTGVASSEDLRQPGLTLSSDPAALADAEMYVVAVPTPIDRHRRPNLDPLRSACALIGPSLRPGDVVVFESTVYPGVTEDICGPLLCESSGLRRDEFKLGYSPERVNPGDRDHTLERVVKVVAGEDEATTAFIAETYSAVVTAGIHKAPTIQVAESAKVIENVQRDLNIALMNELAVIFDRLGIDTNAVLDAAATKWNFHRYHPGLVGGHCIGVDPYYLTTKAEEVGIHPQVILAGRRINDGMGIFVASKVIKLLSRAKRAVCGARIGLLGVTFKANVADIRNSRVPDIARELLEYGAEVLTFDPLADPEEVTSEYGISLVDSTDLAELDALVLAVPHEAILDHLDELLQRTADKLVVVVDVVGRIEPRELPGSVTYWRL